MRTGGAVGRVAEAHRPSDHGLVAPGDGVVDGPDGAGAVADGEPVGGEGGAADGVLGGEVVHHVVGEGRLHQGGGAGAAAVV